MYIAKVPNRSSRPTFLLRESYREGKKVKNRTLANLSHLPPEQIEALRRLFKGERMMPAEELFQITRSLPHGHVVAVLGVLGLESCSEDDFYEAMDWLVARQSRIEAALARQHLREGTLVLYDLTTLHFEGRTCPLAALGVSRNGPKGKLQIRVGLLCTSEGCPVAVEVFEGNAPEQGTLCCQIQKLR